MHFRKKKLMAGILAVILVVAGWAYVDEAGWGELHPLAGLNEGLPATYMVIYSPRSTEENAVIERILKAAVEYAAGPLLKEKTPR